MAHQSTSRFVSLIVSTLLIAMVLVAGVIFYKTTKTVYNRSHAGLVKETVLKSWVFNTKNLQGWKGSLNKFQATGSALEGIAKKKGTDSFIENKKVALQIDKPGVYKVKIGLALIAASGKGEDDEPLPIAFVAAESSEQRIGVSNVSVPCIPPPQPKCKDDDKNICSYGRPVTLCKPTPTPKVTPPPSATIPVTISYGNDKDKIGGNASISVYPYGYVSEYVISLNEKTFSMDWLRIAFGPYSSNYMVQIPYISIVFQDTGTPTPTVCKTGLSDYSVSGSCDGGYLYVKYSCQDGSVGKNGDSTKCQSQDAWKTYASKICEKSPSCGQPTPTPTPSKCYYKQVECFQAPCEPILVCPTPKVCPLPPVCKGRLIVGDPADSSQCPVYQCSGGGVACTQEAKQCSDGSYVGRTGSNCEFAPCPAVSSQ